jgi:hypothetical protein
MKDGEDNGTGEQGVSGQRENKWYWRKKRL